MNEQYLVIIQGFIAYWNLNRQTATLLATALMAVARKKDDLNTAKTLGIMMAYNAAGLIDEDTYQEGHNLVDAITKMKTEREAIDAIYNYFDECDR